MEDVTQEVPTEESGLPPASEKAMADHAPEAVQSLKRAMRRARLDDAERVGIQAELRETQIGRLELLQDALAPLLAQIPKTVDLFDVGLMPGATPRLFIDMIGFVEMGRDARVYRFLQDTRHTRLTLCESTVVATVVDAITDYVARRMLERDKALAADEIGTNATVVSAKGEPTAAPPTVTPDLSAEPKPRSVLGWAAAVFGFVIDLLGATAFFTILAVLGWLLWGRLHGQV